MLGAGDIGQGRGAGDIGRLAVGSPPPRLAGDMPRRYAGDMPRRYAGDMPEICRRYAQEPQASASACPEYRTAELERIGQEQKEPD